MSDNIPFINFFSVLLSKLFYKIKDLCRFSVSIETFTLRDLMHFVLKPYQRLVPINIKAV